MHDVSVGSRLAADDQSAARLARDILGHVEGYMHAVKWLHVNRLFTVVITEPVSHAPARTLVLLLETG